MNRSEIVQYYLDEYFEGNFNTLAEVSGYRITQIKKWITGEVQPSKNTIEYIAHIAIAPEFKVIQEFAVFSPKNERDVHAQLRKIMGEYSELSGIYAFYDSAANLLYVGKATKLVNEIYQSMRKSFPIEFPKGLNKKPQKRFEIVRYISAYHTGGLPWAKYPLHVESLLLRISKPPLNINIGNLKQLDFHSV